MTADATTIGERIRSIRESRKLSLTYVAHCMGVSISLLSKYESNDRNPPVEKLNKLSKALNCSVAQLLGLGEMSNDCETA